MPTHRPSASSISRHSRKQRSRTYCRWTALGALLVAPLGGCEAVLGAEFDDYERALGDAATGGTLDGDRAPDAHSNSGGAGGNGGSGGNTATDGAASTGGSSGSSGGTSGGAGGNGGGPSGDAAVDKRVIDAPGSIGDSATIDAARDAPPAPDAGGRPDVGSPDATSIDVVEAGPLPPRDGGITGGGCTPGEVHNVASCGNCGHFLQTCNAQGVWDPPSCQGSQPCSPGSSEQRVCETNGNQLATCSASCQWSVGACVHPACTAGQVEQQSCALCGQQTRTCQSTDGGAAQWTPLSMCTQQGICAAGSTDVTTCGNCGTHSRVCNTTCAWDSWGTCQGEGECAPGATQTEECQILIILVLGHRTRTCDASCGWSAFSECK